MTRISRIMFATAAFVMAPLAFAQEPFHPRISIVHPGVDALKADLKSMIDLTDPSEQKYWEDLEMYIDSLVAGTSSERPLRVDILSGMSPIPYFLWVPLPEKGGKPDFQELRDNMEALGYESSRDPQDHSLYEVTNEPEFGWARVLQSPPYCVVLLTTDKQDLPLLRQLALKASDPLTDVATLLETKSNLSAELVNTQESAEDQARRRDGLAELRKTSMEAIQQRPAESPTEFALRQIMLRTQIDELERLMVESKSFRAHADYDHTTSSATVSFVLETIAGTSLAASAAEFGTRMDDFAAIPRTEGAALSGRMNIPLDEMRQKNILEILEATRSDLLAKIEESKDLSESEKTATRELLDGIHGLTTDGIQTGFVNAFLESVAAEGDQFTTVGAITAPNAGRLRDILPRLAEAGKGNSVELDVAAEKGIAIHRIKLARGAVQLIDDVFGAESELYVGVAENHVWLASGPNALDVLKSTIQSLGEPAASESVLNVQMHLLPWVKHLNAITASQPEPEAPEDKEIRRQTQRRLDRAIQSLQSDDSLSVDLSVHDGLVRGRFDVEKGLMTFVGKMIAIFTKENFAE